jgi:hypothetical protein
MTTNSENTLLPTASVAVPWETIVVSASDGLQACSEACSGWQQEVARFIERRAEENQRSLQAMMAARDLGDVLRIQQEWTLQAATDYTKEATRLTRLFTSLSLTGTTPDVQKVAALIC